MLSVHPSGRVSFEAPPRLAGSGTLCGRSLHDVHDHRLLAFSGHSHRLPQQPQPKSVQTGEPGEDGAPERRRRTDDSCSDLSTWGAAARRCHKSPFPALSRPAWLCSRAQQHAGTTTARLLQASPKSPAALTSRCVVLRSKTAHRRTIVIDLRLLHQWLASSRHNAKRLNMKAI